MKKATYLDINILVILLVVWHFAFGSQTALTIAVWIINVLCTIMVVGSAIVLYASFDASYRERFINVGKPNTTMFYVKQAMLGGLVIFWAANDYLYTSGILVILFVLQSLLRLRRPYLIKTMQRRSETNEPTD